jgi:hypothetical protein
VSPQQVVAMLGFIFLELVYEVMKFIDRGFNIIRFDHTGKPAVRWFSFVFTIK